MAYTINGKVYENAKQEQKITHLAMQFCYGWYGANGDKMPTEKEINDYFNQVSLEDGELVIIKKLINEML